MVANNWYIAETAVTISSISRVRYTFILFLFVIGSFAHMYYGRIVNALIDATPAFGDICEYAMQH